MAAKVLGGKVVLPETEPLTADQEKLVKEFVEMYFTDKAKCPAAYHYLFESYGPLSDPAEEAVCESNRQQRSEEMKRIVAYKYLMARKWKMSDAVAMFTETSQWRESEGFHRRAFFPSPVALRGYDEAELMSFFKQHGGEANAKEEVAERSSDVEKPLVPRPTNERIDLVLHRLYGGYSNAIHKWDKQGHPVVFEMAGSMNVPVALQAIKELSPPTAHFSEAMTAFRLFENELMNALTKYNDEKFASTINKESGRRVTSVVAVFDCEGVHMSMITSETMDLLKRVFLIDQKYYPEILHRMVVVNCSSIVMMIYNIIKVALDARVRSKFVFAYPEDTPEVLKAIIDEEHLPEKYGGKCRCGEGKGGCIYTLGQQGKVDSSGEPFANLADGSGIKTHEVDISAGHERIKTVPVKAGQQFIWQWVSTTQHEVEFSVTFTPTEKGNFIEIVPKTKAVAAEDRYLVEADGEIRVVFNNAFSRLRGKTVRYRVGAITCTL